MTQDEILDLAELAGHESLIKFAKLVAAKEREECAKVCEGLNLYGGDEYRQLQRATLKDCAYAIRARGQE